MRPDVQVTIPAELLNRSNISLTSVASSSAGGGIHIPAVVEPNAYRQVTVTSLVSGRILTVSADLGASVRRGQILARIHSADLSEAEQRFVAARAMLEARQRASSGRSSPGSTAKGTPAEASRAENCSRP